MKKLLKWFAPSIAAASLFFFAGQSVAVVQLSTPSIAVYTFTGDCSDCANTNQQLGNSVFATLTLQNYLPSSGQPFVANQFVSFEYGGSNLFSDFAITSSGSFSVTSTGVLPDFGALSPSNFSIVGLVENFYNLQDEERETVSIYFTSYASGAWSLGYAVSCGTENSSSFCAPPADYGGQHTYSLTDLRLGTNPNAVPEPGSLLLMGAALVVLGVARRRHA